MFETISSSLRDKIHPSIRALQRGKREEFSDFSQKLLASGNRVVQSQYRFREKPLVMKFPGGRIVPEVTIPASCDQWTDHR